MSRIKKLRDKKAPRPIQISVGEVLIRPVRLENLLANGTIPITAAKKLDAVKPDKNGNIDPQAVVEAMPVINAVVMAAMYDPPVAERGGDDVMGIDEIDYEDKMTIFAEANRAFDRTRRFPDESNGSDSASRAGDRVQDAAV